jgi:hypothetical protein
MISYHALTSINVRSRRVRARNATPRLFCSSTFETASTLPLLDSTPHPLAPPPAFSLLHSYRENSHRQKSYRSKSHKQSRIHRASGSLQTALS